jgi:hypothetical protein
MSKDFLTDEEMQKLSTPDFIPDEEMDKIAVPVNVPEVSKTESAIRGYAQGLTGNTSDEIEAKIVSKMTNSPYEEVRKYIRDKYDSARKSNPKTYMAGEFGGGATQGLATAAIPGGIPARIAIAAASGALGGYGASESDDPEQQLSDTGKGAALGGVFGLGGELLPKGIQGVRNMSSRLSSRALGAERGTINRLGADKVMSAGAMARKEGIVTPLANADIMSTRNQAVQDAAGEAMSNVYEQIDRTGRRLFNPLRVAARVEDEIGGFWRSPINAGETRQLENTLESILMRSNNGADQNISLHEAQILKEELGKVANWKAAINPTDKELMARQAYGIVKDEIDNVVDRAAAEMGDPNLLSQLQQAKKTYGDTKVAQELLKNRTAREQGNKMGFGLTDTIASGYGYAAHGPFGAAATFAGKRFAERYGSQTAATGADWLAKTLEVAPETLGKWGPYLKNAALRGGQQLGVAHYMLSSNDPEYQQHIKQLTEGNDQKKNLLPTKVRPFGEQMGDMIDQASWSDKIGLDPQERQDPELMDQQALPSPAMIAPFSFKKLFPSKSAVGSEIKNLPTVVSSGWKSKPSPVSEDPRMGMAIWGRDLIENGVKKRTWEKELTPSEAIIKNKIKREIKSDKPELDDEVARIHSMGSAAGGAVFKGADDGRFKFGYDRSQGAAIHEHIHAQMFNMNSIHPLANQALENYYKYKLKNAYGIDPKYIIDKMHGKYEFMTTIADMLQDSQTRMHMFRNVNSKDQVKIIQVLRKFWTETAKEAQNMTKEQLQSIINGYL